MATILEILEGVNAYPIPRETLEGFAIRREVDLDSTASSDILKGRGYNLCMADLLMWLSEAPDISQGGQDYSFNDMQRNNLRKRAIVIYSNWGEEIEDISVKFGYKGSLL